MGDGGFSEEEEERFSAMKEGEITSWRPIFSFGAEIFGIAGTFGPFMDVYKKMLQTSNKFSELQKEKGNVSLALIGATEISAPEFVRFKGEFFPEATAYIIDQRKMEIEGARTIQSNAQKMQNIGDSQFDVVFTHWLTHHLPDRKAFINEVYRVLKPGGVMAFVEQVLPQDMLQALEKAGFKHIEYRAVKGLSRQDYQRKIKNDQSFKDGRLGAQEPMPSAALSAMKPK